MSELIIQTRLSPQKLVPNNIRRSRLLKLLDANIDKNLIIVCTPAGYGKTTLLTDYLSSTNLQYAWLTIPQDGINNLYSLINYLVHSLIKINDRFGKKTLEVLDIFRKDIKPQKDESEIIEIIVGTFINEFCNLFKKDIILIIDDLHFIEVEDSKSWLNILLNVLINNIPENLHLIISTRQLPDINISKFQSKRNLLLIGTKDLSFSYKEIELLLKKNYSFNISEDNIVLLEDEVKGWITGIHLILQAYGSDFSQLKPLEIRYTIHLPDNIFKYFANEIFAKLNENTQDFLLHTSLLEIFEPESCNKLLKINKSKGIIKELIQKNLFIQETEVDTRSKDKSKFLKYYNYHSLFRQYLQSKFSDLKSEKYKSDFLKRVSKHYLEMDDYVSAVDCSILAKDNNKAISLIIKNSDAFIKEFKFENLRKWLYSMPVEILNNNPHLLFYMSLINQYFYYDIEKSLEYLDKAFYKIRNQKNKSLLYNCLIQKAKLLENYGKYEEAEKTLNKLLKIKITQKNKAYIFFQLGEIKFRNNKLEDSICFLSRSLELCQKNKLVEMKSEVLVFFGEVYLCKGDFTKSLYYLEQVKDQFSKIGTKHYLYTCMTRVYCHLGDFEKAKETHNKAKELVVFCPFLLYKIRNLFTESELRFYCGDYEETIKILDEFYLLTTKSGFKGYNYIIFKYKGYAFYYLKEFDKAKQNFKLSLNYIGERDTEKEKKLEFEIANSILMKKISLNDSIETSFLKAYKYYENKNDKFEIARISFQLADYYFKKNNLTKCLRYLKESLVICSEKDYIALLQEDIFSTRYLFDLAILNPDFKSERNFVKLLFQNVFNRLDLEWLSDESKERLSIQIDCLYDINMKTFGGLEFFIRGEKLQAEKRLRHKSKLILAYLLLYPNVRLTKDKIIDLFFTDIPLETVEDAFHKIISDLRKATRLEQFDLILYENKILHLHDNGYYKSDVKEFSRFYSLVFSSDIKIEEKIEHAKKAIDLYRGELLEGFYESWCEDIRQEYSSKSISVCEELLSLLFKRKDYDDVIVYSGKLLNFDRTNENAFLYLIESHVKQDNIKRAKEVYSNMLNTYKREIGEKPPEDIINKIKNLIP